MFSETLPTTIPEGEANGHLGLGPRPRRPLRASPSNTRTKHRGRGNSFFASFLIPLVVNADQARNMKGGWKALFAITLSKAADDFLGGAQRRQMHVHHAQDARRFSHEGCNDQGSGNRTGAGYQTGDFFVVGTPSSPQWYRLRHGGRAPARRRVHDGDLRQTLMWPGLWQAVRPGRQLQDHLLRASSGAGSSKAWTSRDNHQACRLGTTGRVKMNDG